jgi:hypothetical protein
MSNIGYKNIRIALSEDCLTELTILAMRKKVDVRDLIAEVLTKHVDKRKEPVNQ